MGEEDPRNLRYGYKQWRNIGYFINSIIVYDSIRKYKYN